MEGDSLLVVSSLVDCNMTNWKLIHLFRECRDLLAANRIIHVFRQANGVADRLAAWAYVHRSVKEIFQAAALPPSALKALRDDKLGLWTFRK